MEHGINTWVNMRYADDGRTVLPPIKAGWKWENGGLWYSKRWELEDGNKSDECLTREVLRGTMMEVEKFLEFTVESGEKFGDGWLPTLETALRMCDENTIEYRFYKK